MIRLTHFTDPGCPWAWSAWPAFATLNWRYGDQLDWELVLIGLREDEEEHRRRGATVVGSAQGWVSFGRRFRMPFAYAPKARLSGTGPGCRAIVATRLSHPGRETEALRALQLMQFTTTDTLDDRAAIERALGRVEGIDAAAIAAAAFDDDGVRAAYEEDRARARRAAGSPTEFQDRAANTDGAVRYTAPSVILTDSGGRSLEVGGFQPVEAYDVAIANLDPTLRRRGPATDPAEVVTAAGHALTTAEVVAAMVPHLGEPDPDGVKRALLESGLRREAAGDSEVWHQLSS